MPDLVAESLLDYRKNFPALDDCVHLISHALGCVPAQAADDLAEFLDGWRSKSVAAWGDWLPELGHAAARIAKILSAPEGTVVMQQSVSGVMALLASCFEYTPERNRIVLDALEFPSVSYVWHAEKARGASCVVVPSRDRASVDVEAMCAAIDEHTVVVPLSHVTFSSSSVADIKAIVARAREVGAHVILDCYQSVGTLPLDVVELGVSFATAGSIAYMCGGPGSAWLYVRKDLVEKLSPRVTGWLGHEAPFAFTMPEQRYAEGMSRYLGGTPAIASLYHARAGQRLVAEIGVRRIREKSLALTQRCIEWVDELGFKLHSPREDARRGGTVVFDFVGAADVCRELERRHFLCDHRRAAGIRISPHFYTKPEEIDLFFTELKTIRGGGAR